MPCPCRPTGVLKVVPEDFVVEEVPAYPASGEGFHVFVRFTKTNLTTSDALRAIAQRLGCNPRDAGVAGMKDKRAVTTQTISLLAPTGTAASDLADRARRLDVSGVTVLDATPHGHKLKPGHLVGNRFAIVVRSIPEDRLQDVASSLDRIAREGLPNSFGPQRFGRDGDNPARALAWLRGQERGPREPHMRRLMWSSVQSLIFNAVLDARVQDGTWTTPLRGDLLKLRQSGGLFPCTDPEVDAERAKAGDVSPTGPILGVEMRAPDGEPARIEREQADRILGADFDLPATRRLGEGSRRPLRVWASDLRYEPSPRGDAERTGAHGRFQQGGPVRSAGMRVCFMLPKGSYATTLLDAVFQLSHASDGVSQDPLDGEPISPREPT